MGAEVAGVDFRSLLEKKEKELVSICERQIEVLQQQVAERDRDLADVGAKFSQLKDDFKYNLELLDGRDAELSSYEAELSILQSVRQRIDWRLLFIVDWFQLSCGCIDRSYQASFKEGERQLQESQKRLAVSEAQRLEERRRSDDRDKLYEHTLTGLREQIEKMQLTREQLLSMHKEAFESASAEFMYEVEKRQEDLEKQSKTLESRYMDRMRIHELQSQVGQPVWNNITHSTRRQDVNCFPHFTFRVRVPLLQVLLDAAQTRLSQAEGQVKQLVSALEIIYSWTVQI